MIKSVLIVGMGSAGRRYLKHFYELGVNNIDVLRSGKGTITEKILPAPRNIFYNENEAFSNRYDAVVIATPSSLHYKYIMLGLKNDMHILTEKPVSDNIEHLYEIKKRLSEKKTKFAVCHNLRYHPSIKRLKKDIKLRELQGPICSSVQFCAYLPDWHPWEDYRESYAAKKSLGGGAALTHIHEIDYLNWILGRPVKYNGIKSSKSLIGTDVDECTLINMEHESGAVSQVLLSLNTNPPKRNLMMYFKKRRVEIDLIKNDFKIFHANGSISNAIFGEDFNFEQTYRDMIKDFFNLVETGSSDLCTIDDAIASTKVVTGIE